MKSAAGPVLLTAVVTVFAWLILRAESQGEIALLFAIAIAAGVIALRTRLLAPLGHALDAHEGFAQGLAVAAVAVLALLLRDDDFALLLLVRVLIITVACLGLNVQFGYAGVVNFAGASFFGVGGYTAAVLSRVAGLPDWIVLFAGGAAAAIIGSVLLLPILRTRGHYAALITIAFALLFRTFLEVNDSLGGPQGLKLPEMVIGPFHFNEPVAIASFEGSFYLRYLVVALLLLVLAFGVVQRLERSWIGVTLDAVRLDETAAATFGLNIARWKIASFTLGNFITGVAGALSAFMIGFIAPNNYTFAESLIFVSILLLGGIGNPWGVALATSVVILLPEKLQILQEYRFLIFAILVVLVLLFRPVGLLPRPLRRLVGRT
ncbi:MAG TPA: branched-chain amino acid ABC transporter permease [Myxococcales bacterium]|nr:branched-chain amino acid ABC transporter permease [Myxococcales bacterium]